MAAYETRVRLLGEYNIDSVKNTSKVDVVFEFRRTDYQYYGSNLTGSAYWSIICDGQASGNQYFTFDWTIPQNTWKEIGRYGFIVTHKADGSKTVDFNGYIYFGEGVSPGSLSATGNAELATIPRATTPALSEKSVDAGESITISTPRASSAFTHTLKYTLGSKSGTIATDVGTSYKWTIPISIVTAIPNTISGICTIKCQTYNGSTLIGTKNVELTITVPSSVVPKISSVTISEAVAEVYSQFGAYVKNKSKLNIVTDASGTQGSTISTCKVTVNGKSYTGTDITTGFVTASGDITAKVTVTDSRGRTASAAKIISVIDYFNPTILSFSALRCTDTGEDSDDGTALKLIIKFKIAEVDSKNKNSYKVELRKGLDANWTEVLSGMAYDYDNTYLVSGTVLDADYSYSVRFTLTDFFTSTIMDVPIGTAFTLVDYYNDGKGISFGKVSEKSGYMEVNLIAEFLKEVIVHSGDEEYNLADKVGEILNEIDGKAPKSHASTDTTYGTGDTIRYGHVKLVNNLTQSAYAAGVALSAYQGYLLDNRKLNKGWTKLVTVPNDANSTITVDDFDKYSEFLINVGPITGTSTLARVLASVVVPKSKLTAYTTDHGTGAHQAQYYNGSTKFVGGITYMGSSKIKIYGSDNSYTELWAR